MTENIRKANHHSENEKKVECFIKTKGMLMKSIQSSKRLNIDFKRPFHMSPENHYLLNIIDTSCGFLFAIACRDVTFTTVKPCLCQPVLVYGMLIYTDSNCEPSFMSDELNQFLHIKSIATGRPANKRV